MLSQPFLVPRLPEAFLARSNTRELFRMHCTLEACAKLISPGFALSVQGVQIVALERKILRTEVKKREAGKRSEMRSLASLPKSRLNFSPLGNIATLSERLEWATFIAILPSRTRTSR